MKAWVVNNHSYIFALTREAARYTALLDARAYGYVFNYTDLHVRRAPEIDCVWGNPRIETRGLYAPIFIRHILEEKKQ